MTDRGRSSSPPGRPGLCAGGTSVSGHRGELLEQLEEAVSRLSRGTAELRVEVLQKVVPLAVQASAELRNAALADELAPTGGPLTDAGGCGSGQAGGPAGR